MLNNEELSNAYERYQQTVEQAKTLMLANGGSGDPVLWAIAYGRDIQAMQDKESEEESKKILKEIETQSDAAAFTALIRVGDGDRARNDLRSKLKKLHTLLLTHPYEFESIRSASTEVTEGISTLQDKYSILENKS